MLLAGSAAVMAQLLVISLIDERLFPLLNFKDAGQVAALPAVALCYSVLSFLLMPAMN